MTVIDQNGLVDICREGQFQDIPTVTCATVRQYEDTSTVLVVLVDPKNGVKCGTCIADDILPAIDEFQKVIGVSHSDVRIPNPNIAELSAAFRLAQDFKAKIVTSLRAERKFETRKSLTVIENGLF